GELQLATTTRLGNPDPPPSAGRPWPGRWPRAPAGAEARDPPAGHPQEDHLRDDGRAGAGPQITAHLKKADTTAESLAADEVASKPYPMANEYPTAPAPVSKG